MAPQWDKNIPRYEKGRFEPITSGLHNPHNLAEQVIAEVAAGLARSYSQIKSILSLSLANHQNLLSNVDSIVEDMIGAGMIAHVGNEESGTYTLKATRLGKIACRHMLSPQTVRLFRKVADDHLELTFFDLLLIISSTGDCEPVLSVDYEQLDSIAIQLGNERSYLLQNSTDYLIQSCRMGGKRLLSSVKMALILRAWTRSGDLDRLADDFQCYFYELHCLKESAERLLMAMTDVFSVVKREGLSEDVSLSEKAIALLKMLAAGLDETTATLTLVPGIGPAHAKELIRHGICDIEELALADINTNLPLNRITRKRLEQWVNTAADLVQALSALSFQEDGPHVKLDSASWPENIDPYRLRRALDLTVSHGAESEFIVIGGLDSHRLFESNHGLICDCADAGNGNICKHTLAVRLHLKDSRIVDLVKQLYQGNGLGSICLRDLWLEGSFVKTGRSAA